MAILELLFENEYAYALLILIASAVFAMIFNFILNKYIRSLTRKTKTDLDDVILGIITKPLHALIIFIGVYFGLKSLSVLQPYDVWIERIFFIGILFIVAFIASRILSVLVGRWFKVEKKFEKTPRLINRMISIIIYIIAFLMILSHFKIEITPLVATLGLGGLAIGLALQNTLSNFFAGVYIVSDQPIKVGDFIELEGNVAGYVEDIGWRSTKIRTLPNNIVIIPNAKLADSTITNNSMPELEMAALVQCGVGYGSDLEKVEKATIDVARKIQKTAPGAVKKFEPFIRYHTFGDSNINFTVILRVEKFVDKYLVVHEFIKELKKRYDKEKIEISWPVRKIYRGK